MYLAKDLVWRARVAPVQGLASSKTGRMPEAQTCWEELGGSWGHDRHSLGRTLAPSVHQSIHPSIHRLWALLWEIQLRMRFL